MSQVILRTKLGTWAHSHHTAAHRIAHLYVHVLHSPTRHVVAWLLLCRSSRSAYAQSTSQRLTIPSPPFSPCTSLVVFNAVPLHRDRVSPCQWCVIQSALSPYLGVCLSLVQATGTGHDLLMDHLLLQFLPSTLSSNSKEACPAFLFLSKIASLKVHLSHGLKSCMRPSCIGALHLCLGLCLIFTLQSLISLGLYLLSWQLATPVQEECQFKLPQGKLEACNTPSVQCAERHHAM